MPEVTHSTANLLPQCVIYTLAAFVAMRGPHCSKHRVASNGSVAIRPICRFAVAADAKWSMNALACAIPTTRTSMEGRGKVVRSAVISGRPGITNAMRRTPSTGPDIET
jgi:hypothetical protein